MSLDDLLKGLGTFKQGVQEFATARAINSAQGEIENMKGMEMNDMKRRASLGQIGNNLALELGKLGAPVSQIQSAVGAIKPEVINNSFDAFAQGSPDAENYRKFEQKSGRENLALTQGFQERMQNKQLATQLQIAGMKAKGGGQAKLSASDVEFGTNAEIALTEAKKLRKVLAKRGNYESDSIFSPLSDPKASADLSGAAYKLAIAYAKIVDPESVAREGEVEAAKKYAIPMGLTTDNKTTARAIDNYIKEISSRQRIRNKLKLGNSIQGNSEPKLELEDNDISNFIDSE